MQVANCGVGTSSFSCRVMTTSMSLKNLTRAASTAEEFQTCRAAKNGNARRESAIWIDTWLDCS